MASLAQELLLLALDDEKGAVGLSASATLDVGLAGALLLDLSMADRVSVFGAQLEVVDAVPTGDEALDAALAQIAGAGRRRKPQAWVQTLSRGVRKRVLAQLLAQGLVRSEKRRLLGAVRRVRHPERDGSVEEELRSRLRAVVLDGVEPDQRTVALLAVIAAADLQPLFLSRQESRAAKERLRALASGDRLAKGVADAVASMQAATIAAISASIAASAAACSATSASSSSC
jgi:hypothetical protein